MSLRETVPATLAYSFAHAFDGWRMRLANVRAWRAAYLRTVDELSAYSERELVDLGISSADIPAIARQQADRVAGAR